MRIQKPSLASNDYLIFLSVAFAVVSTTMNIFCMKSLSFGTPIIICDAGLLVSWGVFLLSNVIVEVWGESTARKTICFAGIISFFILVMGRIIVFIPTLPDYQDQAEAFAKIFSNGPRTIVSSIIAFIAGNFINVHIIQKAKDHLESRNADNRFFFFLRAAFSTLVGQFADNAIFMVLAFGPFHISVYEMQWFDIMTAAVTGTFIELFVESCFVPFITIPLTRHIQRIKKREEA